MNKFCGTIFCGFMLLPMAAQAELEFSGQAVIGYGNINDGVEQAYGLLEMTAKNSYSYDNGTKLSWSLRARGRTDQNDIGQIDEDNIDGSLTLDLGSAGTFELSTYNPIGDYPWVDGELFNRRSFGVFPVLRKRYDAVADSQFNAARQKVDPDVLLSYSKSFGKVTFDIVTNPLRTWDGFGEDEMLEEFATLEGKITVPTKHAILSLQYNDLDDAEAQALLPFRKAGVTVILRRSINEGDFSDYRNNFGIIYRAKNMGYFKGGMTAYAQDSDAERGLLSLNFGNDIWGLSIAGDSDGDLAVEGSYAFSDQTSLRFGWDNGHALGNGFDDRAFPAPVFAPARGSAVEIALVHSF